MSKSIKQQVLDMCEQFDCTLTKYDGLTEYGGSRFVVASKNKNDKRTWITYSHTLSECINGKPNDALCRLLLLMSPGFDFKYCDDGDECEICND